ncbi:hypothetical protein IAU60_002366 [Kwoniella sp. DSM 27419]
MGRKKIEIRPLVDERNRNVTFLKRKAGLMKKAWELSVLCAADVSIIIFSAAGKAYEFSSQELDGEIERYHEYEGMIERRRAPEFAAMALAGEDEDEDDEDAGPSRKDKNGTAGAAPAPRSLKGKESFKARTVVKATIHDAGRKKSKKRRSKSRSHSEKRSFIDSILSGESSDGSSEESEGATRRRRKEHDRHRDRHPERRSRHESDVERGRDGPYASSDKTMAGLQYAMNMHAGPSQSTLDPRYAPPIGLSRDHFSRDSQLANDGYPAYSQLSGNPPSLPRMPSDSSSYRLAPGGALTGAQLPPGTVPYGANMALPTSQFSMHPPTPSYQSQHDHLPSGQIPALAPGGFQWDQNLLARYAEFQLQQNHQRQHRLLLERQRQQLAHLGVPLDERSLLDDIFGGMGSAGTSTAGRMPAGESEFIGMPEGVAQPATEEFVWPIGSSAGGSGRTPALETPMDENPPLPTSVHGHIGRNGHYDYASHPVGMYSAGGGGEVDWSAEGYDADGGRETMALPSPISAGTVAEPRRKMGRREMEEETMGKRMRV